MIHIEDEVVVARPAADVFAFLIEPGNLHRWQASLASASAEPLGPLAPGSRIRERRMFLGRERSSTVHVAGFEPGRLLEIESVGGPLRFVVRHELEPLDGGDATRVRVVATAHPPRLLALAAAAAARSAREGLRKDLETLRTLLEGVPRAS